MSTDLTFFETSVPIVPTLYKIFVAIGWGLLIGNCIFQSMKAMFAGLGFETESPAILLLRTFLFGTLLIFSKDICDIGLSIGKNVIDLLGIPTSVTLTMPDESHFSGAGASWLLVIIVGFILGFQLIKLFFEIAERYVVVAILTLLCPMGLAMGGSKSTKDICTGYIRTYASMIVMMVLNVLFLKLILSALATMPTGAMVLPWCLLVVGIAKTARKADNLVSKIGLNPAITGDPLGHGRGTMVALMAARTIMNTAARTGKGGSAGGKAVGSQGNNSSRYYAGNTSNTSRNATGGTNVGGNSVGGTNVSGNNVAAGATYGATTESNTNTQRSSQNSNMAGNRNTANTQSASTVRFGANSYGAVNNSATTQTGRTQFRSSNKSQVNTNRFGNHPSTGDNTSKKGNPSGAIHSGIIPQKGVHSGVISQNHTSAKTGQQSVKGNVNTTAAKTAKGVTKPMQKTSVQQAVGNNKKARFGGTQPVGNVRHNSNTVGGSKSPISGAGSIRNSPGTTRTSAKPNNIESTDTAKEVLQDISEAVISPKDGENNG